MKVLVFLLSIFAAVYALAQTTPSWVISMQQSNDADVSYISQGEDNAGTYRILTNWSQGWMEFEASTTADLTDVTNPGQAEYLATTSARMLAYAKASEFLHGIAIDAMAGVDKGLIKADVITAKASGTVQNAVVINEECVWKTGPGGVQYPWATVKIGVLLYGEEPNNNLINLFLNDISSALAESGYTEYQPTVVEANEAEEKLPISNITGLIVDARGHQVIPCLSPLILVQGKVNKIVYSGSSVSREYAINQGIVGYVKSEEQAFNNNRISVNGNINPITVEVTSVNDNIIYLSPDDAATVAAADMKYNILDQCRVIILVD